ncbi:vWA domain-containing protein [Botrimarina mediterranea]|uniref:VWFA domain-containing protein n=1 Tax=Botrimarina mediterranea TaxID=2528022 RepID=A0A518K799_9BACT|nr:hypothetical protein [Botrimarina mediterranea]QDV73664.1 hypothetical protein Spa11_18630 [Botrimarina mediterranea]QDV78254.1 hypothetical protein K2D_18610 [Planctomycetes bacterium K2D]
MSVRKFSFAPFSERPRLSGPEESRRHAPERSGRHAICFGWDNSPSTYINGGQEEIKEGVRRFSQQMRADPRLAGRVDVSVWAFTDSAETKCYVDSRPAEGLQMPELPTSASTPLYGLYADIIEHAITERNARQAECDVDIASTWIFVLSDYWANDPGRRHRALEARDRSLEEGINVFLLLAGENPDSAIAEELAHPSRRPMAMRGVKDFVNFFDFVSDSLSLKARSVAGQVLLLEDLTGKPMRAEG